MTYCGCVYTNKAHSSQWWGWGNASCKASQEVSWLLNNEYDTHLYMKSAAQAHYNSIRKNGGGSLFCSEWQNTRLFGVGKIKKKSHFDKTFFKFPETM